MSKTEPISTTLLDELLQTVRQKGDYAVIALLRNARTPVSTDQDIQFVVVSVCNQVGADIEHLLNEHSSDDATKYAKGFIVYYLRTEFEIEWTAIKMLLKHKDQSYLWRLMQNIKTLKPRLAAHSEYHAHKIKLTEVIKDYKLKK